MIEMMPITIVETVGVRYLGWILANDFGMALYVAIDSVVRAVGKIVVWVEAEAEVSTIRISRRAKNVPMPLPPKTALPRTDRSSNWWAGLARPIPFVPGPANACTAKMTIP